ncbi:hypothetical protein Ade02nite_17050 [Paractinoplanes deccanensis]|uniref:Uracil-DNA glycosylase-like domain-containing protein n=1 Tax=Paractinoplanes deccanensis TaxID=113561 RepID=A0ABQ3XZB9_9ACTN|nr:hypothetical protein Ade02nite_17050 [Actinoplanes deccanensis]
MWKSSTSRSAVTSSKTPTAPAGSARTSRRAAPGIQAADITPWNAYPRYINRKPDAAELDAGVQPLVQLLDILTELKVILLQGGDAQSVWRRLTRRHAGFVLERRLVVIETYHPSRQALWSPDPDVRRRPRENRTMAYRRVADIVHG